jgi:hypothetical protein
VQKHSGTLVFFHVELLRSFHGLHLHAPGLSTKAWAEHYVAHCAHSACCTHAGRLYRVV